MNLLMCNKETWLMFGDGVSCLPWFSLSSLYKSQYVINGKHYEMELS